MIDATFPDDPEIMNTMALECKPGTKIRYTGKNGWDFDQIESRKRLEVGREYTVSSIDIGSWKSWVYLVEYPGYGFNTVHFVEVKND